ncbi:hypothetical protein HI914_02722 [Erysiphe necator]|nr:hypothetical protein HI914_02727 [Erysiphe necator]KAI6248697.1 hypothetical protein HI914_02722 [Erysiphe necator]
MKDNRLHISLTHYVLLLLLIFFSEHFLFTLANFAGIVTESFFFALKAKMGLNSALMKLALIPLLLSVALATINEDIREFIQVTSNMERMGVRIATSPSHKERSSEPGLLLEIKPSSLILLPEELKLTPVKNLDWGTHRTKLVVLSDNAQDLRLICEKNAAQESFQEWSIVDLCKREIQNIFSKYINDISKKKIHFAIARGDLEDAPVVKLRVL